LACDPFIEERYYSSVVMSKQPALHRERAIATAQTEQKPSGSRRN
jgi:hypothetical protein